MINYNFEIINLMLGRHIMVCHNHNQDEYERMEEATY